ncbi:MAG TPA: hypothetical protein PK377_07695 [Methanothrix sp.]|nr:hypothetical protein [Methanothrix sp.]
MGWKGTVRSIGAASRRMERESRRRSRELEKQQHQIEKMQELERAAYEVEVYENYIERLQSMHKECSETCDWEEITLMKPPERPNKLRIHESDAQSALDNYKPGFRDKLLKKSEDLRQKLVNEVEYAKETDEREYQEALEQHALNYSDWEVSLKIAEKMISGDLKAYFDAIEQANPFEELTGVGSGIEFKMGKESIMNAILHVNGDHVIPSEAKTLLKNGKLSIKPIPKGKFYEIYQDYVCSSVLRVAREFYALLPADMLIITAMTDLLNTKTGHIEEQPILSAVIPRKTLKNLNFETLDPSDSMGNFVHQMNFKKTKGFSAIEPITPESLDFEK